VTSKLLVTARVAASAWLCFGCSGGNAPAPSPNIAGSDGFAAGGAAGSSNVAVGGQLAAGGAGAGGAAANGGLAGASAAGNGGIAGASAGTGGSGGQTAGTYPPVAGVLDVLTRVNAQFADKWPDPGAPIVVGSTRPSNIWTRAVYYEGLMNLYAVDPKPAYLSYAVAWGEAHAWQLRNNDSTTTNADNQCAGQTYIDLYNLDGAKDTKRITAIQTSIDGMLNDSVTNAWTWVDAIQMSMPVLARFGAMHPDGGYFDAMYALYSYPKRTAAEGLYNTTDHLWWRDANWKAQKTPGGKQVYWSRGNGWVFAALARVLDLLPATDPHRGEYAQDFTDMAAALRAIQRSDGFWNPSLNDPTHFGGPEASGTSLFVYGMAWGIRKGLLDEATYAPVIVHAWSSLVDVAVDDKGFVGYLQSTGDDPSDGQPLSEDKVPDFEDYGVGCVLLAGSELVKLSMR
jgi:unsaturated rhamnogalacturonyl hydrolase